LSVVVITYNEEHYVPLILRSLREQTWHGFEVLVVDSNSTDATEAAARECGRDLPGVRFLKLSETRGPAYGRNRGAEAAAHERLLFLDADTVLAPDFLERTGEEIARRGADVATCPMRVIETCLAATVGAAFLNGSMRVLRPVYSSAYGACLFSSREVHRAVGGFDTRIGICEDCHYVKQARKLGFRFRILSPVFGTSDRRARHEGSTRVMAKYVACHLRRMFTGREILREDIHYTYGDF
jgi:GT2 family glycosyltransferase